MRSVRIGNVDMEPMFRNGRFMVKPYGEVGLRLICACPQQLSNIAPQDVCPCHEEFMLDYGHVMREGTYFYPAFMRYVNEPEPVTVFCDACEARNIPASVSHGSCNLCMACMRICVDIDNRMRRREAKHLESAPQGMPYALV